MAKLAIYRGETLEREIELSQRSARIGRGDQNDIVLPDPAKSVSRFHAELRFEAGRYTIVDLNSQNGTWVGGKRVPQVVLEAGVPVVLGTYRLVLVAEPTADLDKTVISSAVRVAEPAAAVTAPPAVPEPPKAEPPKPEAAKPEVPTPEPPKPEPARPEPPKPEAPKPEPVKVAAPPPPPPARPVAPPPPPPPRPAAPAAVKPPEPPRPKPAAAPRKGVSKVLLYGGFVVLVLAGVAAGVLFWPQGGGVAPVAPTGQPAPGAVPAADQAPPPADAAGQAGPAAEPAQAVVPPSAGVPAPAPGAPGTAAPAARRTDTARAGRRGAAGTTPAPPARPRDTGAMLAQARTAMVRGDYVAAVKGLEAILAIDPGHQDATQMLDMARAGARNAAQLAVDTGAKSEMAGDYDAAIAQYEQAQQLDPSSQAAADAMRRVRGRMQADGEEAFRRARQFDALGRSQDAVAQYERAIKLLPADHASARTARERLAALRGGN